MVFPMNCKADDSNPPVPDKLGLQMESGVLTTSLQSDNSEDKRKWRGSNTIEKIPWPFVETVDTTFPDPHSSWRVASSKQK